MNSIMLYASSMCRAHGAQSSSLLTSRGSTINPGGDPDPDRAGLSRGDIERVVRLYPKQRAAPQQGPAGRSGNRAAKRWSTVPEDHETQPQDVRAWPPGEDGSRTIHYCFENQASYDSLHEILALALLKWAPAVQVSALAFAPDAACSQGPCLCSTQGVAEVTLRISLADPKKQQAALTTVGYKDPIVENPHPNMPRHYIMWPYSPAFFRLDAALNMAHELGKSLLRKASTITH